MNFTRMHHSSVNDSSLKSRTKMSNYSSLNATLVSLYAQFKVLTLTFLLKFEPDFFLGEGKAYKAYEVLKEC